MGTIQMALPSTSVLTAYNERIGVLDMPYLFTDAQSAFDALDGKLGEQIDEWIAGNRLHQPRLCLQRPPLHHQLRPSHLHSR